MASPKSITKGTFVLSLCPFGPVHAPPIALHIDPSVTPSGRGVKVLYTWLGRPPRPATVLSQDQILSCILPDGQDLPMLVSLKHLYYHP